MLPHLWINLGDKLQFDFNVTKQRVTGTTRFMENVVEKCREEVVDGGGLGELFLEKE